MFYEDFSIGQSADLGFATFSREAILAYGRRFDPRIFARAAEREAPLAASGLHVAAAGMRRLVEARNAFRAEIAARGEALPELGVSPGFKDMRWRRPCWRATLSAIRWRPSRSVRPPNRNGVWSATDFAASTNVGKKSWCFPASFSSPGGQVKGRLRRDGLLDFAQPRVQVDPAATNFPMRRAAPIERKSDKRARSFSA